MRTRSGIFWRLLAVLLAITLVAAACGSDDDDSADESSEDAAADDEAADDAAADDEEMADDDLSAAAVSAAGDPVELNEDVLVGYLQWVYADEAGKRIEDAAADAVDFLGWDYVTCDAGGDPAQMPICGNQLLDQDIDVMLTDGIPEEFIQDVLEQADAAGIPVLSAGGEVDPRNFYLASYASDDTDMGFQVGEQIKSELPDGGNCIVQTFPAAWSAKRSDGLAQSLDGSNIVVVDTWENDPTNMVEGTEADVTTKMQQFDVDCVVIHFSVASIGAANAVGAAFPDGGGPVVLTFYANPTTVDDIRSGRLTGAVDEKLEWQSWAQVDAVAQLLAREVAPSQERAPDYGGINFSVRQMVTSANTPDTGDVPAPDPPGDYAEFFRTKWCADFTNLAACS
jgi:ABC-type sugar transport system substrate-binding protein